MPCKLKFNSTKFILNLPPRSWYLPGYHR